ncbi:hypothetical protein [Anaerosalibacter massiliensis]|uniref:Uncharacterized protein n=1 Tax=Anaerosalibacter massiliensis TaxID=1347392 RepID=A0A9X2MK41_9FIRM|nr:hypothetical protein [Anaerosalibacter massiliensis]MCR2044993.1 hypothetical protein [Anaerosalibacter massiliensis]
MACYNCGNCKENNPTYYCIARDEVIINENYIPEEKKRDGWKEGNKSYEFHRRNTRKEMED